MSAQSQTLADQLSQEFCRLHPIEAASDDALRPGNGTSNRSSGGAG